jgi:Flp pilus assembly pilin Flp
LSGTPAIREEPTMNATLKKLWEEEEGQDLTEYALLMVLIALVSVASMQTIGTTISNVFSNAAVNLSPS